MAPSNPNLIGQIALQEGYISAEQLDACLRAQNGRPLGTVLLEKGVLTPEKLDEIVRIQKSVFQAISADPLRGGLFGQIALRLGYVSEAQLSEALREQARDGRGGALRLGQILLKTNALGVDQFLEVLRRQQKEVVRCPGCDAFYDALEVTERFVCSACGTVVHKPAP